jgi:2-keto-4-pentenoate hydratase/2-oxohepta-3-ene-1,7-dioic acid hydratase in catechol pathway
VRIARFSVDDEPKYGVVETDDPEGLVGTVNVLDSDPLYRPVQFTGERLQLADVRLLAPVIPRSKVVCVGRNYAAHAQELGNDVPEQPMIFLKPNTSVIGPRDGIVYPEQTSDLHFEGELAIVIGRICRDLPKERADEVIFGYTVANDVTARDLQKTDGQWTRAKGFDTFCALGAVAPLDGLHRDALEVVCRVNGEVRQHGRVGEMAFSIPQLIAYISGVMTLEPGDVIATGTPAGVSPLHDGDLVEVEIPGVGSVRNPVKHA